MIQRLGMVEVNRESSPKGTGLRRLVLRLLLAGLLLIQAVAYAEGVRKIKNGTPPEYPEIAKRFNIRGPARVQATVAPDGTVQQVKELGGNPILVDSLARAVRKWRYERTGKISVIEVKFDFGQQ
jgi:outer membrane biosynthesis protein TonB